MTMITTQRTPLQRQLDGCMQQLAQVLPPEVVATIEAKMGELERTGIEGRGPGLGERAPDFVLPNAEGERVRLGELLGYGPVVLSFYRGSWCPFCNLELRALQEYMPRFQELGAQLVAVSPQTPDHSLATAEQDEITFEVLSDSGNQVARQFGLVFTLPEELRPIYQTYGIDLPAHNGDASFELPVPATYVIDTEGVIRYAFVNADYRRRAEPEEILAALTRWGAPGSPGRYGQ
jgi:peroxiredoxin